MELRLQKYIAECGIASRRAAEELILAGRVSVNGETVTELGAKISPDNDIARLDGKIIRPERELVYIMLNKPEGYVTSVSDPQGRPTVMELVEGVRQRLVPVGRLDYNTSGLLLMTNDGDLVFRLTHPSHEIEKTYAAKLKGELSPDEIRKFKAGVFIDGVKTAPAKIKVLKYEENPQGGCTSVRIAIHEGKNRQIRKMCDAIGHPVLFLKRVGTGNIFLGELKRGEWRFLTAEEVGYLKGV
ncbi:MAG: rRNA pseudouridine synthase [Defluviitaleaceae bacterium]|nr:rRNA pseudouridine synthase [Defluviitaleaceae bacterium]